MPYSKTHKENTRRNILLSGRKLFSARGFELVTVDEIMADCEMTRGAFYAHFDSKADLYQQAFTFSASFSDLFQEIPDGLTSRQWLDVFLDNYLSVEHLRGDRPCPLAFLVTDVANPNADTRATYESVYQQMNDIIRSHAGVDRLSAEDAYAMTSMLIGAVAVARSIEDIELAETLIVSTRQQVEKILGGVTVDNSAIKKH